MRARLALAILLGLTVTPLRGAITPTGKVVYVADGELKILEACDGTSSAVPLPAGLIPFAPTWSRDGSLIAVGIGRALYTVRPDGSSLTKVRDIGPGGMPDFSPDASRIAFHDSHGGWKPHIVNTDGTGLTILAEDGVHVRWSPDGRKLVYSNWAAAPGAPYESDMFVYDLTTNQAQQITFHEPNQGFVHATWSPDSTQLAISVLDHVTSLYDIWVMNADGTSARNITVDLPSSSESYPSWSPDGHHIIFLSNISGNSDIWAMRPDGSFRANLTTTPNIEEQNPWVGVPEPSSLVLLSLAALTLTGRRGKH